MLYRLFDATLIKMPLNFIPSVAAVINASIADSTFYVDIVRLINFIIISSIVFQLTPVLDQLGCCQLSLSSMSA